MLAHKDSPARIPGTEAFSGARRGFLEYPKVDLSRWFPEDGTGKISAERLRFAEHIESIMKDYHLYLSMYAARKAMLIFRHCVIGRKPQHGS